MMLKIFKQFVKDDSGSAIILALIIIAGLATTGLGAARLTKSNTEQTRQFEDSLKALYAAEAGVEAALLEWRFDHDVEFWNQDEAAKCAAAYASNPDTDDASCDNAKMTRVVFLGSGEDGQLLDMTASAYNADGSPNENFEPPVNLPWYEMKIYYRDPKEPRIGDPDNDPAKGVEILKDETFEIRFPDSDDVRTLDFRWVSNYNYYSNPSDDIILMWHPVAEKSGEDQLVQKEEDVADPYYSLSYTLEDRSQIIVPSSYSSGMKAIRIKCLVKTSSELDVNGNKKGVYISFKAKNGAGEEVHIPKENVNIEVIGHYNETERQLDYTVSRQSGTILDIFDHGVFSQATLSK